MFSSLFYSVQEGWASFLCQIVCCHVCFALVVPEPYAGSAGLPPPRSASMDRWREEQEAKRRGGPRVKVSAGARPREGAVPVPDFQQKRPFAINLGITPPPQARNCWLSLPLTAITRTSVAIVCAKECARFPGSCGEQV